MSLGQTSSSYSTRWKRICGVYNQGHLILLKHVLYGIAMSSFLMALRAHPHYLHVEGIAGDSMTPRSMYTAYIENDVGGPADRSGTRRWDGIWCANPYDIVAKEHHFEEEGNDYVEEDNWDDEYPAHARICLERWLTKRHARWEYAWEVAYCLENGIHVCANKVPRDYKPHSCECPPQYCEWGDADKLDGRR